METDRWSYLDVLSILDDNSTISDISTLYDPWTSDDTLTLSDYSTAPIQSTKEEVEAPPAWNHPSAYPEGGAAAWLTVSGSSACFFVSMGWINCIGIFQDYYQLNQLRDYTPSEIAWIPALQVFFMLFGGIFIGKLFDDYGPRHLLFAGTLFHVFGLMMTSLSTKYYQILLSQAFCSAIGASLVFYPAITCASTWFLKKRGAALGLVVAGSSLGGVIFPIMVVKLMPKVGFGWTMRICAFLILVLLVYANLTVRSRIPPNKRPFRPMAFLRPFADKHFSLLSAGIFFFYWGMFVPITFIVVEARSHGMSSRLANYLVPILNAASIVGRTVPNIIADKAGFFNVMVVMSGFTSFLILALWLPATTNAPIIAFAAFFGIASGAGIGLTPAIVASISPITEIGIRSGSAFSIAGIAALTGSPIAGQIISVSHGTFRGCMAFGGVSCAIGTVLFVVARISIAGVALKKV